VSVPWRTAVAAADAAAAAASDAACSDAASAFPTGVNLFAMASAEAVKAHFAYDDTAAHPRQ